MSDIDADLWLAQRIATHTQRRPTEVVGAVFAGVATPADRRERLRAEIVSRGLAQVRVGKRAGSPETYAEHFERRYGIPLQAAQDSITAEIGQNCGTGMGKPEIAAPEPLQEVSGIADFAQRFDDDSTAISEELP